MQKIFFSILILSFLIIGGGALAQDNSLPPSGITPDSPFYFLKTWKESVQTFFTFGAENKAKQYFHLSEVRLAEYQKMIEKGKTEIAKKTLTKYEQQLNHALEKAEEAKEQGKNVEKLKETISEKILKHREILENVLEKAPEQAKPGIEKAIETSQKGFEKAVEAVSGEKKEELEKEIPQPQSTVKKISVQRTSDGGHIAAGVISMSINKSNIYLVKTDANGNIIWEKNYKAGDTDGWGWGQSVRQTADGGYIVLGVVLVSANPHIYLLKVNTNGNTQWNKTFGEYYSEIGYSVQQTSDGGYFVTANTRPGPKGNEADIHLIKTDADGNIAWDKLIDPGGQREYDYPLGAKQASDGGFIIIEYTEDERPKTGLGATYLMKINADGNMDWRKILGKFKGYLINIDSDGGYIIISKDDRDSYAIKKTKTDTDGNILWTRPVDGNVP